MYTSFRLNLLYAVSSKDETFALDMFVREQWNDPRLAFSPTMWNSDVDGPLRIPTTRAWKPDTFFYNAIATSITDSLLILTPTGDLSYTRHYTCTFHISFDLTAFPFDSQTFNIERLSFAYSYLELDLVPMSPCWVPDPSVNYENSLWSLNGWSCVQDFYSFRGSQQSYARVTANLNVSRLSQNYVVKLILPMFIIVLLSTLTYWIDPKSAPARVGGTVTLVLSIVTFNLTVSSDLTKS